MKEMELKKSNVSRANHTSEAYDGIRQMLFHNEIVPGQKIGYRDLSERLKMSMTPVIQALKFLEFQGLVRHEPNRGYYTEPIYIREVEEIYDIRNLIEVSLLPESIKQLDENGIHRLRTTLESHKMAIKERRFNQRLIEHKNFHLTLASLSECRTQLQVLRYLFDLLYLKFGGSILFASFIGKIDTEHQEIFEAVVAKDLELSKNRLSEHILNTKTRVIADVGRMISEKETVKF